jgi:hypothetical protein
MAALSSRRPSPAASLAAYVTALATQTNGTPATLTPAAVRAPSPPPPSPPAARPREPGRASRRSRPCARSPPRVSVTQDSSSPMPQAQPEPPLPPSLRPRTRRRPFHSHHQSRGPHCPRPSCLPLPTTASESGPLGSDPYARTRAPTSTCPQLIRRHSAHGLSHHPRPLCRAPRRRCLRLRRRCRQRHR